MMTFMFSVLGSVLFWGIAIPVNFVIGIIVMKMVEPGYLHPFTKNQQICGYEKPDGDSYFGSIFMILVFMLFWWGILLWITVCKMMNLIFPLFIPVFKKMINAVPEIKITTKEK